MNRSNINRILDRLYYYSRTHSVNRTANIALMNDYIIVYSYSSYMLRATIYAYVSDKDIDKYTTYFYHNKRFRTLFYINYRINKGMIKDFDMSKISDVCKFLIKHRNNLMITMLMSKKHEE